MTRLLALAASATAWWAHSYALAAEKPPVSPYIDELRKEDQARAAEEGAVSGTRDPYIQSIKKKLDEQDARDSEEAPRSSTGYTRELQKELGAGAAPPSYTEQERAKLGGAQDSGGAIQAVKEGRSELQGKREGEIHHAGGFRINASSVREISASSEVAGAGFDQIYGSGYTPEVTFFYEYQPWHSEWFGSLGLAASLGVSYSKGTGVFAVILSKPDGTFFDEKSHVDTQFFAIPAMIGLNYRFNLLRVLRPFVTVGPSLVGFYETRSDEQNSHYAAARAVSVSAGASLLLDWVSKESSWDLYKEFGIQHFYLTVEYNRLSSLGGPVTLNTSGFFAGLAFEF